MIKKYATLIVLFVCTVAFANNEHSSTFITSGFEKNVQQDPKGKVVYSNGMLTISGIEQLASVEVYDVLGKKVFGSSKLKGKQRYRFSVTLQKRSMYIVRVQTPKQLKSFKIIAL